MRISRKWCIRSTPCLVLGKGFQGWRMEWRYFRFNDIQDGGWRSSWNDGAVALNPCVSWAFLLSSARQVERYCELLVIAAAEIFTDQITFLCRWFCIVVTCWSWSASYSTLGLVNTWIGDSCTQVHMYVTNHLGQLSLSPSSSKVNRVPGFLAGIRWGMFTCVRVQPAGVTL